MPRIHNPTTLRSRNRVTNKTRLRIHRGDIDFDPDDTPIPISNDTAGVDAEDANVSNPFLCLFCAAGSVVVRLVGLCLMAPSDWLLACEFQSMDC